jgi:hypothetical protein
MCCGAFFVVHTLSWKDEWVIWGTRIAAATEEYVFSSSQVVPQKGVSRIRCHFSLELFLILMPFCADGCWLFEPRSSRIVSAFPSFSGSVADLPIVFKKLFICF